MEIKTKKCTKCGIDKEFSEFNKHKLCKYGLSPACRTCAKIQNNAYRSINKEEMNEKKRKRYSVDHEFKEKVDKDNKKWREENKSLLRIYHKDYNGKNKEKRTEYKKEYRQENKYVPTYIIGNSVKRRLINALKNTKYNVLTTIELLGCTLDEAAQHIEKQFNDDMSWRNHGLRGWHIDHIKPCASFDLSDVNQQRVCFHYTNLQPLWAKDNLIKSSKCLK